MIVENFKRLIRFDRIRLLKLVELCQFTVIGLIIGLFNALFINRFLLVKFDRANYVTKDHPNGQFNPLLWLHIVMDVCVLAITTYYLKKIATVVPFAFSFLSDKYVPGMKGEGTVGFSVGIGFVYLRSLTNFQSRLEILVHGT